MSYCEIGVYIWHAKHTCSCTQIGFITSATTEAHSSLNCKVRTAV